MTLPARVGERVYRGILRLYPADFRDRFGEEMVQLFNDKLRDARTGRAPVGSAGAWLGMLGDVAATAALEHVRRKRTVAHSLTSTPTIQARVLGAAGIMGGAVLLAAFLIDIPTDLNTLRIILINLAAIAVILAVHQRQAAVAPRLALVGAVPAVLANAWYLVMILLAIGGLVLFWAGVALWVAFAWFGFVTFRIGAVTRWGALAVTIGAALTFTGIDRLGLTSEAAPTIFGPLSQIGIVMMGIGWILLGLDVAMRRRATRSVAP